MTRWVALLRAVNVGGTGKVAMAELKALCEGLGFGGVRTYIASGNVLLSSDLDEAGVRGALEAALLERYGKPIGVLVRSAADMAELLAANPWPDRPGNRVVALLTDAEPSLDGVRNQNGERLAPGPRALFIDYGEGMADSKLIVPASKTGTARNLNTVAKLAELAASA
ncbi:DUF1697 domain-containing protein [Novosphingobium sp. B 225]|uniref:DUF1697 domain-containing protein n=1 Tax=Novosphingobium sp. B 225 TaxID=1961849 RepID=UPI000B4B8016|nr:DUF1697 domain-containing protein [Novosphingobium sp. B 225]